MKTLKPLAIAIASLVVATARSRHHHRREPAAHRPANGLGIRSTTTSSCGGHIGVKVHVIVLDDGGDPTRA